MKRLPLKKYLPLLSFLVLFILIRSINFQYHLNFSTDQALFSSQALSIIKNKTLTLIGPKFSLEYDGRFMFQGPLIYYFLIPFLLLGNYDPIKSSFIFMIFCSLMLIPLYFGTRLLINKNAAILFIIIYALFPVFINYTRFLWNPNFQFALLPLLLLLMGIFKKQSNFPLFWLSSATLGLLLQFHYSFLIVIVGLFFYYFFYLRVKVIFFAWVLGGDASRYTASDYF